MHPIRPVVCFGDSITHGVGYAEADRWTTQLAFHLEAFAPGRYAVHNRGIGGNTTSLALDRIQTDVLPLLPGLVLLEFGINDAYVFPWARIPRVNLSGYRENLREIIRQIRAAGGDVVLIVNHPLTRRKDVHPQGNGRPVGRNLTAYNRAALAVARAEKVSPIDLPTLLKSGPLPMETFWSEDGVHLSPAGNRLYARLIFDGLVRTKLVERS